MTDRPRFLARGRGDDRGYTTNRARAIDDAEPVDDDALADFGNDAEAKRQLAFERARAQQLRLLDEADRLIERAQQLQGGMSKDDRQALRKVRLQMERARRQLRVDSP